MEIVATAEHLQALLTAPRRAAQSIGLVPTMGCFHEGHLSLMRCSRERDGIVVVSLYVNPTQFGPGEDYLEYPRDIERDARMAETARVDMLFAPPDSEMYPPGDATFVEVAGELTARLCGAYRPGHFRGVATVVSKLLNLVQPQRAYFGEKDYQQLLVVRRLALDLRMPVEIVSAATVREPDGLAMSSRNIALSPAGRKAAAVLYRSLQQARDLADAGERDGEKILARVRAVIAQEPLVRLEYAELADPQTLAPVANLSRPALAALAAHVDGKRLIDNMIIGG